MTVLTEIGFKTRDEKEERVLFLLRLEVDADWWFYSSWVSLKKVEASPRQIGHVRFVWGTEKKMSWKNQQFYEIISFFSACASDATQRLFLLTFLLFSTFVSIGVEAGDQISLFVFKWAVSFLWVFFEDRSQAGEEVNFKFGSRDERAPVRKGDAFGIWNLEFDI